MIGTDFDLPEGAVCEKTGLNPAEIKKKRGAEGGRWQKTANGRVMWSAAGVAELETELATTAQATAPPEPLTAPPLETFTVVRARTSRVLHVVRAGQTYDPRAPLCVWLPQCKAHLFRPGMTVLGRQQPGRTWVWDFEGNPAAPEKGRRMPRAQGKW